MYNCKNNTNVSTLHNQRNSNSFVIQIIEVADASFTSRLLYVENYCYKI